MDPSSVYDEESAEGKLIDEEYKIWKKNTGFLYDLIVSHVLAWPSLSVDFHPQRADTVILGTNTSGQDTNFLTVVNLELPTPEHESDSDFSSEIRSKIVPKVCIAHEDGDINRARHSPRSDFLIATKSTSGNVLLFDWSKFESNTDMSKKTATPTAVFEGHTKEGYALDWSPFKPNLVVSGAEDGNVLVFDVEKSATDGPIAMHRDCHQHRGVNEVQFHRVVEDLYASCGDDSCVRLWDLRSSSAVQVVDVRESSGELNALAWNCMEEHLFAVGGSEGVVRLFDIRRLVEPVHEMGKHNGAIFSLAWSPHYAPALTSASDDRRVFVWDIARIGDEQTPQDAEDGPPELLFIHGGHTSSVMDASWHPLMPWVVGSVSQDNILQLWEMASNIHSDIGCLE
eukprot:TRINITY_DN153_c0_g1_i1.p1 TRINITY_DN153_c0_g1~~TRINITY_DN153_c0_g1_i1.p1  ORF type:complete len:436 (-),score=121.43 TRINITY_DN153_c0_g1_i1:161-1354(-)